MAKFIAGLLIGVALTAQGSWLHTVAALLAFATLFFVVVQGARNEQ